MMTFMLFVVPVISFLFCPTLFSNGQPDSVGPMGPVCPFLGQKRNRRQLLGGQGLVVVSVIPETKPHGGGKAHVC